MADSENTTTAPREDVIEQIVAQITASGFDEAHALIVRPIGDGFQIISGHNRRVAAERAGLDALPCWVREMDDATAYMELVRANAQGELTALERGMHALGFVEKGKHGKSAESYAKEVGREKEVRSVRREIDAAEVAHEIGDIADLADCFSQLVEVHTAPRWLWRALVAPRV